MMGKCATSDTPPHQVRLTSPRRKEKREEKEVFTYMYGAVTRLQICA